MQYILGFFVVIILIQYILRISIIYVIKDLKFLQREVTYTILVFHSILYLNILLNIKIFHSILYLNIRTKIFY